MYVNDIKHNILCNILYDLYCMIYGMLHIPLGAKTTAGAAQIAPMYLPALACCCSKVDRSEDAAR